MRYAILRSQKLSLRAQQFAGTKSFGASHLGDAHAGGGKETVLQREHGEEAGPFQRFPGQAGGLGETAGDTCEVSLCIGAPQPVGRMGLEIVQQEADCFFGLSLLFRGYL